MILRHAAAGGGALHSIAMNHQPRKLPPGLGLAVGTTALMFAGISYWLFTQTFSLPLTEEPRLRPTIIDIYRPKSEPPPRLTPQKRSDVHKTPDSAPIAQPPPPVPFTPSSAPPQTPSPPQPQPQPATSGEAAQPQPVQVITDPSWQTRPGPDEMARFYPPAALAQGIEGKAVMRCQVTAAGALTACAVVSETPAGKGFGAAAVRLSRYFRMKPRTVDGRPVEGGMVTIPLKFTLN